MIVVFCRFFSFLGTAFSFVSKDVHEKLKILEHYLHSDQKTSYQTVKSMITHETATCNLKVKGHPPNGCRTLLRLHRAMEFIALFLQNIKNNTELKLSDIAHSSYQETLAAYHPWIIRKGVGLAMYTLPSTEKLLAELGEDRVSTLEHIDQLQNILSKVFTIIQKYYEEHKILDIP